MGIADEKPASGLFLELADVLADRRLAQAQALGGPGETSGLDDREEGLKQDRIQHGSVIMIYDYNNSCKRNLQ
jgi:hypothetical protein